MSKGGLDVVIRTKGESLIVECGDRQQKFIKNDLLDRFLDRYPLFAIIAPHLPDGAMDTWNTAAKLLIQFALSEMGLRLVVRDNRVVAEEMSR